MLSLCVYSKATGGTYEDQVCCHKEACPLQLTQAEGRNCPCKRRTAVGRIGADPETRSQATSQQQVMVAQCLFPETYTGNIIRNPIAFGRWLKNKRKARAKARA